jgi:hypothetical protein
MRPIPASNPTQKPRRRGRASIATLVALCALAGATHAFAPAPAVAMDDVNFGSGCQPGMGLPSGFGLNEFGEVCTYEVDGGGSGSGPLGVGYGGGGSVAPAPAPKPVWMPGEVNRVVQQRDPVCKIWPESCPRPGVSSRAPRQYTEKGSKAGGPSGGGGRRANPPKVNPVIVKRDDCDWVLERLTRRTDYRQAPARWKEIVENGWNKPPTLDSSYVQGVLKAYKEMRELVRQWNEKFQGNNCSAVTGKNLPDEYKDVKS